MSADADTVVNDRSVEFLLRHDDKAALPALEALLSRDFDPTRRHWRDAYDEVQQELRQTVWAQKSALEEFDNERYLAARNALFPLAVSGRVSTVFSNRAGYKLMECMEVTGVWQLLREQHVKRRRRRKNRRAPSFADLCGGPGAFAEMLLAMGRRHGMRWHGYGLTLTGVDGLDWYPKLLRRADFTACYGVDGTGDIFCRANVDGFASVAAPVCLVVADGGFHVEASRANFQETISARITYSQWLLALKLLARGGCLVLKLFDTFAPATRAMLYLSTFIFATVRIVKPCHSRVVNSERYLVCVNFCGLPSPSWMAYLNQCYDRGFVDADMVPEIVPDGWVRRDRCFMHDLGAMNATIATQQVAALRMVVAELKRRACEVAVGEEGAEQQELHVLS